MVKFVIVCMARSGCTLIGKSLALDHPDAVFFGELFHPDLARRAKEARRETINSSPCVGLGHITAPCFGVGHNDTAYLENFFSSPFDCKALGFKLNPDWRREGGWPYVCEDKSVRIIHLIRRNYLDALVSFRRAMSGGVWHSSEKITEDKVQLSIPECAAFFRNRDDQHKRCREELSRPYYMEVNYEKLCADFDGVMGGICNFLEVGTVQFREHLKKMATLPVGESVVNYGELKDHFMGGEFEYLFRD